MITNPLDVAQNEMYQTSESGLGEEVWVGLLYSFIHLRSALG